MLFNLMTVTVTPSVITIGVGGTLNISSSVAGGVPPFTFSWVGPNGFTANTPNISIPNVTPANSGTYTLTVTDSLGCEATASSDVTVTQCVIPIMVSITPPSATVNAGSNVNLAGNASGGVPPYSFSWAGPNGFAANTQNITIPNITPAQAGAYILTVIDSLACQNSATAQVIVASCSTLTVAITPPVVQVPLGSSFTLTGSATGATQPVTFLWTGPDGFTATTSSITITNAGFSKTGIYTLLVTDSVGCQSTATASVIIQQRSELSQSIKAKYC